MPAEVIQRPMHLHARVARGLAGADDVAGAVGTGLDGTAALGWLHGRHGMPWDAAVCR